MSSSRSTITGSNLRLVCWLCELSLQIIDDKAPKWIVKGDEISFDQGTSFG